MFTLKPRAPDEPEPSPVARLWPEVNRPEGMSAAKALEEMFEADAYYVRPWWLETPHRIE
ncbi:MAG: hypothetical protein KQH57_07330 [Actinomycetales bacterium]|nr:hypothetical protein [Actinomycetales bacterium]